MKYLLKAFKIILLVALALVILYGLARWRGLLVYQDEVRPAAYEILGIDASSYQGRLDWDALMEQGVSFAFLKATEGSNLKDSSFTENWASAGEHDLRVGAYHFFSYDSSGESQAENFISMVPVTQGALPPVIDLEFYGKYLDEPKAAAEVVPSLRSLLELLQAHYGQKPILYVTDKSYRLYVQKNFGDYPLWVSFPVLSPFWRNWSFWQYSHYAELEGYEGPEQYIDLNVFRGSQAELASFGMD